MLYPAELRGLHFQYTKSSTQPKNIAADVWGEGVNQGCWVYALGNRVATLLIWQIGVRPA